MKSNLVCAAMTLLMTVAAVGTRASGAGNQSLPAPAEQALKKYYRGAETFSVVNSWEQNGVRVYEASITTKNGQRTAIVTEHGEVMKAGIPEPAAGVPPAVQDVSEQIFQQPSKDIDQYTFTYYFVNIQPHSSPGNATPTSYELKFDATGQLLALRSYAQAQRTLGGRVGENDPARHNLAAAAQRDFSGVTATDVHTFRGATDHYVVSIHKNNQPGWVVMDKMGMYYSSRIPIELSQLPQAVQKTLNAEFKSDIIRDALRGNERLYRVEQNVGGEQLVILVHPNGDVVEVLEKASQSGAGPAQAHHRAERK